jgi:predicted branched-subunit amino acid permease
MWMIANQRLHAIPLPRRLPWLLGVGATLMAGMLVFTALGFFLAERLPPTLAATLVFFTPSFFLLSLFGGARLRLDYLAIGLGALIGAVAAVYAPKFDLLLGGLVGGTLAYILGRPRRRWLW